MEELFVAVAFVIFVVVFGRKIWTPLAAMLDARGEAIRGELAEAARLRQEAEALLKEAQARREAAELEAKQLVEGAQQEASRVAAAAAAEAEAAAKRRERMALDRIAAAEKAAVDEVRHAAADVATQAVQTVVRDHLGADTQAAMIDHAIAALPAALASRRAA
jgi:F-type H+-transporting ATPase subunit b